MLAEQGMCRRHYAERPHGGHHFISIAGAARLDEDLVWLKLESKNHQLATLAINIVISLSSLEPPEYQSRHEDNCAFCSETSGLS